MGLTVTTCGNRVTRAAVTTTILAKPTAVIVRSVGTTGAACFAKWYGRVARTPAQAPHRRVQGRHPPRPEVPRWP